MGMRQCLFQTRFPYLNVTPCGRLALFYCTHPPSLPDDVVDMVFDTARRHDPILGGVINNGRWW